MRPSTLPGICPNAASRSGTPSQAHIHVLLKQLVSRNVLLLRVSAKNQPVSPFFNTLTHLSPRCKTMPGHCCSTSCPASDQVHEQTNVRLRHQQKPPSSFASNLPISSLKKYNKNKTCSRRNWIWNVTFLIESMHCLGFLPMPNHLTIK
uniref:(northern house mosquito) hypothetical protein n=1 Tax=Culex pipiens TaxID=7175 RepID=A0A8D8J252_CULPI